MTSHKRGIDLDDSFSDTNLPPPLKQRIQQQNNTLQNMPCTSSQSSSATPLLTQTVLPRPQTLSSTTSTIVQRVQQLQMVTFAPPTSVQSSTQPSSLVDTPTRVPTLNHQNIKQKRCFICHTQYSSYKALLLHTDHFHKANNNSAHDDADLECCYCHEKFSSSRSTEFNLHQKSHLNPTGPSTSMIVEHNRMVNNCPPEYLSKMKKQFLEWTSPESLNVNNITDNHTPLHGSNIYHFSCVVRDLSNQNLATIHPAIFNCFLTHNLSMAFLQQYTSRHWQRYFIPIWCEHSGYWLLLILDKQQRKTLLIDPRPFTQKGLSTNLLPRLKQFIDIVYYQKAKKKCYFPLFPIANITIADSPNDSGPLICTAMGQYLSDPPVSGHRAYHTPHVDIMAIRVAIREAVLNHQIHPLINKSYHKLQKRIGVIPSISRNAPRDISTLECSLNDLLKQLPMNTKCQRAKANKASKSTKQSIIKLYDKDKAAAIAVITNTTSSVCTTPVDILEKFFHNKQIINVPLIDENVTSLCTIYNSQNTPPVSIIEPTTVEEVQATLSFLLKKKHSAPGPDGLSYNDWTFRDPHCTFLSTLFNVLFILGIFPNAWKQSHVTLIPKPNSQPSEPGSLRPIAKINTASKLFTALITRRLSALATTWCWLIGEQRGFISVDGCCINNKIIDIIDHTHQKPYVMLFVDLKEAFPSIQHSVISAVLKKHSLCQGSLKLLESYLDGCSQQFSSIHGCTKKIKMFKGVRQGDPLSPLLFNITFDIVLRNYLHNVATHGIHSILGPQKLLAFADDVVLFCYPENLNTNIASFIDLCSTIGLEVNLNKCLIRPCHMSRVDINQLTNSLQFAIPITDDITTCKYLGIDYSLEDSLSFATVAANTTLLAHSITHSSLAPWQKLDAINTFAVSKLIHHFRNMDIPVGLLENIAKTLVLLVKECLDFNKNMPLEYIYATQDKGGLGFQNVLDLYHLHSISASCYCLYSSAFQSLNAVLQTYFWNTLLRDIQFETIGLTLPISVALSQDQLLIVNNCINSHLKLAAEMGVWKKFWMALLHLKTQFNFNTSFNNWLDLIITIPERKPININITTLFKKKVGISSVLHPHICSVYMQLHITRHTKTTRFFHDYIHPVSYYYITAHSILSIAEYKWVLTARANNFILKGSLPGHKNIFPSRTCRRCDRDFLENLAHILCNCTYSLSGWCTTRHDAIIRRICDGLIINGDNELLINRTWQFSATLQRPDIIFFNHAKRTAVIVDVTIVSESSLDAFQSARTHKINKYAALQQELTTAGYYTTVDAIVCGMLGSWSHFNNEVLSLLGIAAFKHNTMARLIIANIIQASHFIYKQHVNGKEIFNRPPTLFIKPPQHSYPTLQLPKNDI